MRAGESSHKQRRDTYHMLLLYYRGRDAEGVRYMTDGVSMKSWKFGDTKERSGRGRRRATSGKGEIAGRIERNFAPGFMASSFCIAVVVLSPSFGTREATGGGGERPSADSATNRSSSARGRKSPQTHISPASSGCNRISTTPEDRASTFGPPR